MKYLRVTSKVAVKCVSFLLFIRDLEQETGYSEILRRCPQSLRKFRENASNETTIASFHILSNSFFTNHPVIPRYVAWSTELTT
jgi:hypothetical protein